MSHVSLTVVLVDEKQRNEQLRECETAVRMPLWAVIHH